MSAFVTLWGALCATTPLGSERLSSEVIRGRLLEGCSCSVPCPCNFGQASHPHAFCDSLAFFLFERGNLRNVELAGLQFALVDRGGSEAYVYLDSRLTEPPRNALTKIGRWILSLEGTPLKQVLTAPLRLDFEDMKSQASAGSEAELRVSLLNDNSGRTAITVLRPIIYGMFPVLSSRKGLTHRLRASTPGLQFEYMNTNANDATFEFHARDVR
jgi:hypothetical protein